VPPALRQALVNRRWQKSRRDGDAGSGLHCTCVSACLGLVVHFENMIPVHPESGLSQGAQVATITAEPGHDMTAPREECYRAVTLLYQVPGCHEPNTFVVGTNKGHGRKKAVYE